MLKSQQVYSLNIPKHPHIFFFLLDQVQIVLVLLKKFFGYLTHLTHKISDQKIIVSVHQFGFTHEPHNVVFTHPITHIATFGAEKTFFLVTSQK